jgi:hypothetical protein
MSLHRHASYRVEDHQHLIEINLREPRQLFNSLDPAPFHEKDLDASAEEYIVSAVQELGTRQQNKLVIYLPEVQEAERISIPAAISHYFAYRAQQARADLQQLLRFGSLSLLIGVAFLCLCLMLREGMLQANAGQIVTEGLLIVGWVALWRPLEVFLYEWWPIRQRQKRFQHIANMPMEVRMRG